jgi:hypothetical protein
MIAACDRELGEDADLLDKLDRCRDLLHRGPSRVLTAKQLATLSCELG